MKEIALHLLDIAENSLAAGADKIDLRLELTNKGMLILEVRDNGKGMDADLSRKTMDPFYSSRETRKIGLGIPLLKQHAEVTGGSMEIRSAVGKGTLISAVFCTGHPDIQPLGDVEGCWTLLASANKETDITLSCITTKGVFEIGSFQVMNELETPDLQNWELRADLKSLIRENLEEIGLTEQSIEHKIFDNTSENKTS